MAADLRALSETLEGALVDAMAGDPWGPALEGRLQTVARQHLLRAGLGKAQVRIRMGPGGVEVHVVLPPGPSRVRQLVLSLGHVI